MSMCATLDVFKEGSQISSIPLSSSKKTYTVGRDITVDVQLDHKSISRSHATITVSQTRNCLIVKDSASAQGTFISGRRITPNKEHILYPGRSLVFGASSRVYKLRCSGEASSKPPSTEGHAEQPWVDKILQLLRAEVGSLSLRPDGYVSLVELIARVSVGPFQIGQEVLLEHIAQLEKRRILQTTDEEEHGVLVRALYGHSPQVCIDTKIQLDVIDSTPQTLVFGARFTSWNAVRSRGIFCHDGGVVSRLWTVAPAFGRNVRMPDQAQIVDLFVFLSPKAVEQENIRLYLDRDSTKAAAQSTVKYASEPKALLFACETGTLGPHLFEKVVSAFDGSEIMSECEIENLRQVRKREGDENAAKVVAVAERKRQKQARDGSSACDPQEAKPDIAERFNPYLEHWGPRLRVVDH